MQAVFKRDFELDATLCLFVPAPAKAQERKDFKKIPYPFHISQKPRPQTRTRTILTTPSDLSTVYPRPHIERDYRERPRLDSDPYSCLGYRGRRHWIARHRLRMMRSKIERSVLCCSTIECVAGGWDEARCEPYWRWRRVAGAASRSASFLPSVPGPVQPRVTRVVQVQVPTIVLQE